MGSDGTPALPGEDLVGGVDLDHPDPLVGEQRDRHRLIDVLAEGRGERGRALGVGAWPAFELRDRDDHPLQARAGHMKVELLLAEEVSGERQGENAGCRGEEGSRHGPNSRCSVSVEPTQPCGRGGNGAEE